MADSTPGVDYQRRGRYGYDGIVRLEPDESAIANLAENIASIVNNYQAGYYQPLQRIMQGVQAGLIDPNDALVQGTRGGRLFEKFYGVQPPEPRRPEMVETTAYPATMGDAQDDPEAAAFAPRSAEPITRGTGRMTGGFNPATLEQLQRHVIAETSRGRQVPQELVALSGLLKTPAQERIFNPDLAAKIQAIKNDPKRAKILADLQYRFPNASPAELLQWFDSITGGSAAYDALGKQPLGDSKDQIAAASRETVARTIAESRERTWGERLATLKELQGDRIRAQDAREQKRIDAMLDMERSRAHRHIVTRLWDEIGENAMAVADELVYGEGDIDNLPSVVRDAAKRMLTAKQGLMAARAHAAMQAGKGREDANELRRIQLEQAATRLEMQMQRMAQDAAQKADFQRVRAELQALAVMIRDPARRGDVAASAERLLQTEFGWSAGEPEGALAVLSRVAQAAGIPIDLGRRPLVPSPQTQPNSRGAYSTDPGAPLNKIEVPRPKPKQNSGAVKTPEAQKFLEKYAPRNK